MKMKAPILCFLLVTLAPLSLAADQVRLRGRLSVSDTSGPLPWKANTFKVSLIPEDNNCVFVPRETDVDPNFQWYAIADVRECDRRNVVVTAIYSDYFDFPKQVEIPLNRAERVPPLTIHLRSPLSARNEAFALGNKALAAGDLQKALSWYDRALHFRADADVYNAKGTLLEEARDFQGCAESFRALQQWTTDVKIRHRAARREVICRRKLADKVKTPETWMELADRASNVLQDTLPPYDQAAMEARAAAKANLFDALLELAGTANGDLRRFSRAVTARPDLGALWSELYFNHHLGQAADRGQLASPDLVFQDVSRFSIDLGRPLQ